MRDCLNENRYLLRFDTKADCSCWQGVNIIFQKALRLLFYTLGDFDGGKSKF